MKLLLNGRYIQVKEALSFKDRLYGLMGQTSIDYGMLFPNCNGVHTFFMKENIDIIGLNEKQEIIFLERDCEKNKIIKIHRQSKKTSILELPKNASTSLELGDRLFFEFENII